MPLLFACNIVIMTQFIVDQMTGLEREWYMGGREWYMGTYVRTKTQYNASAIGNRHIIKFIIESK